MTISPTGPSSFSPQGRGPSESHTYTLEEAIEAAAGTTGLLHVSCGGNPFSEAGYTRRDPEKEIPALPNDVPKDYFSKLEGFGGRVMFHLIRLTSPNRSEAERKYGIDFLRYHEKALDTINENPRLKNGPYGILGKIKGIHGDESPDTTMIWTLSPYLYAALRKKSFSEIESLKRIFTWTIDGFGIATRAFDEGTYSPFCVNLKGIEHFNDRGQGLDYYLTLDSNDASHKYSEQLASELVESLLSKPDWAARQCDSSNIKW